MTDKKKDCPFVFVRCMTFNHEAYIRDALNGFVMQQTTFPFVVAIINDASTDKTKSVINEFVENNCIHNPEIDLRIEEYGTVLDVTVEDNPHCIFHIVHLNENHYGKKSKLPYFAKYENAAKYVAMCEGDDYWTDPLKLQKQVDFLEANPEYSMCFHGANIRLQGVDRRKIGARCENIQNKEYSSTELFAKWIVPTASIMYNKKCVSKFTIKHPNWATRGDIILVLKCSHVGKVWGMSDKMSVYRMQPNSVSHNPKYRNPEVYKLPHHFRCIYKNFNKVDKGSVTWNISHAYYARMKVQNSVLMKICDFISFVIWNPKFASSKIKNIIIRKTQ